MDDRPLLPANQLADAIGAGFQSVVDGLRDDVREDIHELRTEVREGEKRVTARVIAVEIGQKDTRDFIETFATGHGREHEQEAEDRRQTHGLFYDFIRKTELDAARRDGALGVIRWSFELLSKHAVKLAWIVLSIGAAAGVATGNIELMVGR